MTRAYPPLIISINRQVIDSNRKYGQDEPPIRIQRGRSGATFYGHTFETAGEVRGCYEPATPLKCGARLWLETTGRVKLNLRYPEGYVIDFLQTLCVDGHIHKVKPAVWANHGEAIFGSAADFCGHCQRPIILTRGIYKSPKKETRHGR